jgi:hypothetical protein
MLFPSKIQCENRLGFRTYFNGFLNELNSQRSPGYPHLVFFADIQCFFDLFPGIGYERPVFVVWPAFFEHYKNQSAIRCPVKLEFSPSNSDLFVGSCVSRLGMGKLLPTEDQRGAVHSSNAEGRKLAHKGYLTFLRVSLKPY